MTLIVFSPLFKSVSGLMNPGINLGFRGNIFFEKMGKLARGLGAGQSPAWGGGGGPSPPAEIDFQLFDVHSECIK